MVRVPRGIMTPQEFGPWLTGQRCPLETRCLRALMLPECLSIGFATSKVDSCEMCLRVRHAIVLS